MKAICRKSKRGFTLVEVIVSSVLVTMLLSMVFVSFIMGTRTYGAGKTQNNLQTELRIASDAIRNEIRYASDLDVLTSFDPATALNTESYIYLAADGQTLMLDKAGATAREIMSFGGSDITLAIEFTKDAATGSAVSFSESISGSSAADDVLKYKLTGNSAANSKSFEVKSEVTLLNLNSILVNVGYLEGPVATPPEGDIASGTLVYLTAESGTTIYYTTDGVIPTLGHREIYVTGVGIPIWVDTRITAIAVRSSDGLSSDPAIYDYQVYIPKPSIMDIKMTPSVPRVGNTLNVIYTFKHEDISILQGPSTVEWFRDGVFTGLKQTYLSDGSVQFNYTTTNADKNKFISVVITPIDVNGLHGDPVTSAAVKIKP